MLSGNCLTVCGKSYKVFQTLPSGSIRFEPKFSVLWKAFEESPDFIYSPAPYPEPLPPIPVVTLIGKPDPNSRFTRFSGNVSSQSAITRAGLFLQPYRTSESSNLSFEFEWKGSESIQFVSLYGKVPGRGFFTLEYDSTDSITEYPGPCGKALMQRHQEYGFVVSSTSPDWTLTLSVRAVTRPSPPLQEKVCLAINGCSVPLFRYIKVEGNLYRKVVEEQWKYVSFLVLRALTSIDDIRIGSLIEGPPLPEIYNAKIFSKGQFIKQGINVFSSYKGSGYQNSQLFWYGRNVDGYIPVLNPRFQEAQRLFNQADNLALAPLLDTSSGFELATECKRAEVFVTITKMSSNIFTDNEYYLTLSYPSGIGYRNYVDIKGLTYEITLQLGVPDEQGFRTGNGEVELEYQGTNSNYNVGDLILNFLLFPTAASASDLKIEITIEYLI